MYINKLPINRKAAINMLVTPCEEGLGCLIVGLGGADSPRSKYHIYKIMQSPTKSRKSTCNSPASKL